MKLFKSLRILFFVSNSIDFIIILLLLKSLQFSLYLEVVIYIIKLSFMFSIFVTTFLYFNRKIINLSLLGCFCDIIFILILLIIVVSKLIIKNLCKLLLLGILFLINLIFKILIIKNLHILKTFLIFDALIPSLDCYLEQQSLIGGPQEVFRGRREIYESQLEDYYGP